MQLEMEVYPIVITGGNLSMELCCASDSTVGPLLSQNNPAAAAAAAAAVHLTTSFFVKLFYGLPSTIFRLYIETL